MEHRKKFVCAISNFCTIIDDICWKSPILELHSHSNTTYSGIIKNGPGIFIIYGHFHHGSLEPLTRKVKITILISHKDYKNKIYIKDILSTKTPKIAQRIIVPQYANWEINIVNKSLIHCKIEFFITKRIGLDKIFKYKIDNIILENSFASNFTRDIGLPINTLSSYQKERLLSILDKWPEIYDNKILQYPINLIIPDLERNSVYKNEAYKRGLIRPFLLLVSMNPELRIQFGNSLRIDLLSYNFLGDSHQEAYEILFHSKKGISERASTAFKEKFGKIDINWYQILYRCTHKAMYGSHLYTDKFKENLKAKSKNYTDSLKACLNPKNTDIFDMEEIYVSGIISTIMDIYKETEPIQWEEINNKMYSDDINEILKNLSSNGFTDDKINRLIAVYILRGGELKSLLSILQKWIDSKREGRKHDRFKLLMPLALISAQITIFAILAAISPLIVLPIAALAANSLSYVYRDTPGKLLEPLILLTMQRIILACHNIQVMNYYPNKKDFDIISSNINQTEDLEKEISFFKLLNS